MSPTETDQQTDLMLPSSVATKLDLSRLVNEFEKLDSDLTSAVVRTRVGASNIDDLNVSESLAEFLKVNQLRVGDNQQRSELMSRLRRLKDSAPSIHMTFAAEIDLASLQQLAHWLRQSIHRHAVIVVGLQPSLIGGVYLRTPNKVKDLSIRAQLAGHRDILVSQIEALAGGQDVR